MTALQDLLNDYRHAAVTEREKGTYFEELIRAYLRHEATYQDLYSDVWTYSEWAKLQGLDGRDVGIDLVAKTRGTDEIHAIQCKLYAENYRLQKKDIDSFFTASGRKPFTHRVIVSTTNNWSEHADEALRDQQPPVSKIDLHDLENSQIDWSRFRADGVPALKIKKNLLPHQQVAHKEVVAGLRQADRGKLIMACGTGKTFTSLKIAETLAGRGKRVLFLVPSLALLSQTLTEWTQETTTPLHSFAVCSDSDVGKKRKKGSGDEDKVRTFVHELRYPATTSPERLAQEFAKRHDDSHMSVVFSTYHSIDVLSRAQQECGLPDFDLIICDEAHRTTGVIFENEDESHFVKVHKNENLRSAKRLYMTATPRIYGDAAKAQAETDNAELCSMNDESLYGKELHVLTFSKAVQRGLLVDYKVIVLSIEERVINRRLQGLLKDDNNQLKVDDAARIIGCWKALAKLQLTQGLADDDKPMKRAVAFCQVIEQSRAGKTHKVASKTIAEMFQEVVEAYQNSDELPDEERMVQRLHCEAMHVDGSMNASEKETRLAWLKAETPEDTCRILSNVRCLSEGVDVPALDAVLFLSPRNSQVDVVQSVGRVMRKDPAGKKHRGYVVLPVVIPAGVEPHEALNDNQTYKVVWQVLQALRSHDDRFDAMVNKLDLIGKDPSKMEVIAITDKIQRKTAALKKPSAKGSHAIGAPVASPSPKPEQFGLEFEVGEIERAIYAKLVQKVGNRHHWEDWANDIAKIARTHIDRITALLENPANTRERGAFSGFAAELRDDLNDSITDGEIIEMLAQHLITKPVFDALFEGYSFAKHNPMSQAMQGVLDVLQEHHLEKEADTLQAFYESVKFRAEGINSAEGKQKIVVELYDKFFANAFPRMTDRLGIVYTPVEVVDFIIHSVAHILQTEFGQSLGSKGVHILDPFTGTGTFITRLLQSGLIAPEQLPHKYRHEIHANEIVLLAYYIAAINIEATYHGIVGGDYLPFEGICLTDTFQMYEKDDLVDALLVDNSERRKRQKELDIRVIIGNPPYSVGQENANDNNQNVPYPYLDSRVRSTYAERSHAGNVRNLYDSYIRAIRWASDRVGESGVIGFVTNAGFLEAGTADGLRRCLAEEFSSIYVIHLRGNQRTSGELSRKEGGKIFGSGSRAPIAISFLVKNPASESKGQIHVHDIGDYLSREEKLEKLRRYANIAGISATGRWQDITPDEYGDWLKQRDGSFVDFLVMGDKRGTGKKLFENFTQGVTTARDAWCFNPSRSALSSNVKGMIDFYNSELARFNTEFPGLDKKDRESRVGGFISGDSRKISWTRSLKQEIAKDRPLSYEPGSVVQALYRPFTKQWLYYNRALNEYVYQMPRLFPSAEAKNRLIVIKQRWSGEGQLALMTDRVVEFQTDGGTQCFPLYVYDDPAAAKEVETGGLFDAPEAPQRIRRDAITTEGMQYFHFAYPGEEIGSEDVFYYVYGILHSEEYRDSYRDNLAKELPRIPRVKNARDFWAFSKAGRDLAELHVGYENAPIYPAGVAYPGRLNDGDYRVEKMRFGKKGKEKDRSTVHYNDRITITGIPLEAYDYVVNGKPALEWVMERQQVKTDKNSGIVNDANDWAVETVNNPKYPLELFLRMITVSLETMKIVRSLPSLELLEEEAPAEIKSTAEAEPA